MSSVQSMPAESIASQRDAFIERFLQSAAGTFSLFSIYIGDQLGPGSAMLRSCRSSISSSGSIG
jgi:hypothetical protein